MDKESNIQSKKDSEAVRGSNMTETESGMSMVSSLVSSSGKTVNRSTSSDASCTQVNGSSGSQRREHSLKEPADQLNFAQNGKRKWTMEVLARKIALMNLNASKENQEDTVLKGKYPLLAQLPMEMRPVLAPTCQTKVSVFVRQFMSQLDKRSQSVGTDQSGKEDDSVVAPECSKVDEALKLAVHSNSLSNSPCRTVDGNETETTAAARQKRR